MFTTMVLRAAAAAPPAGRLLAPRGPSRAAAAGIARSIANFTAPSRASISSQVHAQSAGVGTLLSGGLRRSYMQQSVPATLVGNQPAPGAGRKLVAAGLVFGGSLIGMNLLFNRETRDDGGMPAYERDYLNSTFAHTGVGIAVIGLTARQMIRNGFVFRIMATSPWVVAIGGLAASIGTMIATRSIDPDNTLPKYAMWTAFNATQAAMVAPLIAFVPAVILARAGLYTVAMMGTLSVVGATAKQDKYLYIGGPLMAAMAVVLMSGLAPLVVPATAVRTLAMSEHVWLYGGLAVIGGFTLYDVHKILHHARLAERQVIKRDPVSESIGLELDFINIFIRLAQILMMQQAGRKK